MNKKTIAKVLSLTMVVSILMVSGCGTSYNASDSDASTDSISTGSVSTDNVSADAESRVTVTNYGEYSEDNPYQLRFAYCTFDDEGADVRKEVQDAMNDILIPQYHIEVELYPLSWNFGQEESLLISGGDKLDVMLVGGQYAQGQMNMGGIVDLRPYLDSDAGEPIKKILGEKEAYVDSIGDFTFAIPSVAALREYVSRSGWVMRADICDELGFTEKYHLKENRDGYFGEYYSWDTAEEILRKVKEAYPDMIPLYYGKDEYSGIAWFDFLNDYFGVLDYYADPNTTTVVNMYETQTYRDQLERLVRWYDDGLIYNDSVNMEETKGNMMLAGNTFAYPQSIKGGDLSSLRNDNFDFYTICLGRPEANISSSDVSFTGTGISANSDDPDMAWNFIVALYTNPDIMTIWQYGIEGKHYQILDDGSAYYVDGENAMNYTYHKDTGWQMGDYTAMPVWNDGYGDTSYFERRISVGDWAQYTAAFGFNFDSTEYQTQITALNNVRAAYFSALEHGAIGGPENIDSTLEKFNDALYAAGLQEVMDAKQEQLNAWLEENGGPAQTPQKNLDKIATAVSGD